MCRPTRTWIGPETSASVISSAAASALETVRKAIARVNLPVTLAAAAEYYLDENLLKKISSEKLMTIGEKFAYVDILANPEIRANLPKISNWPTFPQLFVKGELVGGCDIMMEMYQSGQLQTLLKEAAATANS